MTTDELIDLNHKLVSLIKHRRTNDAKDMRRELSLGDTVKFPANIPSGSHWLDSEEKVSYEWSYVFGSDDAKDGGNAVAATEKSVFVAGFSTDSKNRLQRFLAKLDLKSGDLIWKTNLPTRNSKGESAFESLYLTKNGGLVGSGFVQGEEEGVEGFKSYGNPQSGKAFLLHLSSCLLYTSPSPRDRTRSRMPSSA